MLPDSDDPPAVLPKRAIDLAIPAPVRRELLPPERAIAGRHGEVLRTGVPETPVHEHNKPRLPKNEVRFAENSLIPSPAGDAVRAQSLCQRQFCVPVAAPARCAQAFYVIPGIPTVMGLRTARSIPKCKRQPFDWLPLHKKNDSGGLPQHIQCFLDCSSLCRRASRRSSNSGVISSV